ncbi:WxL domain-containing protein [Enterococcus sp. AZ163]|uniref:WxL domain-containing protein n=1 Tax=Enterococcus sp. AZ163 TaxID=2774638 RepID=UPI003D26FECF
MRKFSLLLGTFLILIPSITNLGVAWADEAINDTSLSSKIEQNDPLSNTLEEAKISPSSTDEDSTTEKTTEGSNEKERPQPEKQETFDTSGSSEVDIGKIARSSRASTENEVGPVNFANITDTSVGLYGNYEIDSKELIGAAAYYKKYSKELEANSDKGPGSLEGGNGWEKIDLNLYHSPNGIYYLGQINDLEIDTSYSVIIVFLLSDGQKILRAGKETTTSTFWDFTDPYLTVKGTPWITMSEIPRFTTKKTKVGAASFTSITDTTAALSGNYEIDQSLLNTAYAYYKTDISDANSSVGSHPDHGPVTQVGGNGWTKVDLSVFDDGTGKSGTYNGQIEGLDPSSKYSLIVVFVLSNGTTILRAGGEGKESVRWDYNNVMYPWLTYEGTPWIAGATIPFFTTKEVSISGMNFSEITDDSALVTGSYSGLKKKNGVAAAYYKTGLKEVASDKGPGSINGGNGWTKLDLELTGNENGGNYIAHLKDLSPSVTYSVIIVIEFDNGIYLRAGNQSTESVKWNFNDPYLTYKGTPWISGPEIPNFTTEEGQIGAVSFSDITSNSAQITGSYHYENNIVEQAAAYYIKGYGKNTTDPSIYGPDKLTGGNGWTMVDLKLNKGEHGGTYEAILTGLEQQTDYSIIIIFTLKDGSKILRAGNENTDSLKWDYNERIAVKGIAYIPPKDIPYFVTSTLFISNTTFSEIKPTSAKIIGTYNLSGENDLVENAVAYYKKGLSKSYQPDAGPKMKNGGNGWTKVALTLKKSDTGGTYEATISDLNKNTDYSVIIVFKLKDGTTILRAGGPDTGSVSWDYNWAYLTVKNRVAVLGHEIPYFKTGNYDNSFLELGSTTSKTTFNSAVVSGSYKSGSANQFSKKIILKYKEQTESNWLSVVLNSKDFSGNNNYQKELTNLKKNTIYQYYVTVLDRYNNELVQSPSATFQTKDFFIQPRFETTYRSNDQLDLELGYDGDKSIIESAVLSYRKKGASGPWRNRPMKIDDGKITFSSKEFSVGTHYQAFTTITTKDGQIHKMKPDELFTYDVTVLAPLISTTTDSSATFVVDYNHFIGHRAPIAAKNHFRKRQSNGGGAWQTFDQSVPDASSGNFTFTLKNLEEYTLYETYSTVYFENGEKQDSPIRMFSTVQVLDNLLALRTVPDLLDFGNELKPSNILETYRLTETAKHFTPLVFQDTRISSTGWELRGALTELKSSSGNKLEGASISFEGELKKNNGEEISPDGFYGKVHKQQSMNADGTPNILVKASPTLASSGVFVYYIDPESVKMIIPGNSEKETQDYSGQLQWTLENVP